MNSKLKLPALIILASLFLTTCFPFFERKNNTHYDDFAAEDAYYATQAAKETGTASVHAYTPNLRIETVPEDVIPDFQVFSQYIEVFGLHVYASADIPPEKVIHAAGVLAQYLDNDADGKVDAPEIIQAMQAKDATLIIFAHPDSPDEAAFIDGIEYLLKKDLLIIQPLYGEEIVPNGAALGEFDASLEEILHLITSAGYAQVYPEIFGLKKGTTLADAMDAARGGYFDGVPDTYPTEAWFTYDDESCDYPCMVTEYHYWALTSLLGAQDFPGRFDVIAHEWQFNTPEKLRTNDPAIYALLTDPQYHFPTTLPDGNYQP